MKRWLATILYLDGSSDEVPFDEFEELGSYIEHGHDWNTIKAITVVLQQHTGLGDNNA